MATLQDLLAIPQGWTVAAQQEVVDLGSIDPLHPVETETVELWALDLAGIEFGTPNIVQALQQAAQQHGSNVYFVALLRKDDPDPVCDPFGIGICLPGNLVSMTRYRFLIVHSQFQALAILLGALIAIGVVVVWVCDNKPATQPCGQQVTSYAHDTLQQLCQIFGAGCAVQALANTMIWFSVGSIGLAALIFALEFGLAEKLNLKPPQLPRIPPPIGVQPPRLSATVGAPEIGPQVRVATGGRAGGRRRMG